MQCHFFLFDMDDWKLLCYNEMYLEQYATSTVIYSKI